MTIEKSTRLLLWLPHGLNNKTYSLVGIHTIWSFQTRSLNIIETFSNLYVPLDCSEQDYVGFEIPVFIAKKY